jgi:hypothetical protein
LENAILPAKCFLHGFGTCSEKITKEHYISDTVLRAFSGEGNFQIGGLAWQKEKMALQDIGISSLTSKILCKNHNSQLSPLDEEAGRFVRHVIAVDKCPESAPNAIEFDGEKIQRWMLKTIMSTLEAGAFQGPTLSGRHKRILLGGAWPSTWGLYAEVSEDMQIFTQDLYLETAHISGTSEVVAARFRLAGIQLTVVIASLQDSKQFGLYRPRGFVILDESSEKKIGLKWRGPKRNKAVIFNKIGQGNMIAPHQKGWKGL